MRKVRWTEHELRLLRELYQLGRDAKAIARALRRTLHSVEGKINWEIAKGRLQSRGPRHGAEWQPEELRTIARMSGSGPTEIARALNRTKHAVVSKLREMRGTHNFVRKVDPDDPAFRAAVADRDRRAAMDRPRFGDPLPGYSALDRMRSGG